MKKMELSIKDSSISFVASFILSQTAIIILVLLGSVFFAMFGKDYDSLLGFLNSAWGYLILLSASNFSMVAIFYFYKSKRNLQVCKKFNWKKLLLYISIGMLSYILLYPSISLITFLINNIQIKSSGIPYTFNSSNFIISLISLAVLPAICEELLFRGIIFKGLQKHGKAFSIICSAIMFSIFHMSVEQIAYPFLMGLLLAVIMYYENNIIYCIIVHFLNNITTIILAYLNISIFSTSSLYISIAIIFALIYIVTVLFFIIKKSKIKKIKMSSSEKLCLITSILVMIAFYIVTINSI